MALHQMTHSLPQGVHVVGLLSSLQSYLLISNRKELILTVRDHSESLSSQLSWSLSKERRTTRGEYEKAHFVTEDLGTSVIQPASQQPRPMSYQSSCGYLRSNPFRNFLSQADSFKVHKNSSKNFKSILRNHLKWKARVAVRALPYILGILTQQERQGVSLNHSSVSPSRAFDNCPKRRWLRST